MVSNGLRTGGRLWRGVPEIEEKRMAHSLRENMHLVSDPRNLDSSVEEIFEMMLGSACYPVDTAPVDEPDTITAVVGFGGLLSGACVFRSGASTALSIAAKLAGMDFPEIDDTVKDAIGEICNMVAGAWKGRIPDLSSQCGLSIPAVITGSNYRIHVQSPEFQLHHIYQFEDKSFAVTIICDGLQ